MQRSGQPVSRTNTHGRPAWVDSPCTEWKISVIRTWVSRIPSAPGQENGACGPVCFSALWWPASRPGENFYTGIASREGEYTESRPWVQRHRPRMPWARRPTRTAVLQTFFLQTRAQQV